MTNCCSSDVSFPDESFSIFEIQKQAKIVQFGVIQHSFTTYVKNNVQQKLMETNLRQKKTTDKRLYSEIVVKDIPNLQKFEDKTKNVLQLVQDEPVYSSV